MKTLSEAPHLLRGITGLVDPSRSSRSCPTPATRSSRVAAGLEGEEFGAWEARDFVAGLRAWARERIKTGISCIP